MTSDKRAERWLIGSLLVIAMAGLLVRGTPFSFAGTRWCVPLSPVCGDLLVFFGGIGSVGLLCSLLFGMAKIERPLFWLFLFAILGAALHFVVGD
jgi:hypothetical protein